MAVNLILVFHLEVLARLYTIFRQYHQGFLMSFALQNLSSFYVVLFNLTRVIKRFRVIFYSL